MATALFDARNDDAALSLLHHFSLSPELSGTAYLLKKDPAWHKSSEMGMMNFWRKLDSGPFNCYWHCFCKAFFTMGYHHGKKLGDKLVVSHCYLIPKLLIAVSRTLSRPGFLKCCSISAPAIPFPKGIIWAELHSSLFLRKQCCNGGPAPMTQCCQHLLSVQLSLGSISWPHLHGCWESPTLTCRKCSTEMWSGMEVEAPFVPK